MLGAPVLASGIGDIFPVLQQVPRGQHRNYAVLHFGVSAGTIEPHKIRLFSEPDQLSTGLSAVLLRNQGTGGDLVSQPPQVLHRLPVDQAA